jgi:hypothetical protein
MAPRREVGAKILGNAPCGRNLLLEERQQIIALRKRRVPVKELIKDSLCNEGCDRILLGLEPGPKLKKYELLRKALFTADY